MPASKLRRNISEYELYIFDLDGTLYFQKPFRVRMAVYLATYLLTHPTAIKDVLIIKRYREVREKWDLYEKDEIGKKLNMSNSENSDECSQNIDGNGNTECVRKLLSMEQRQYEYVAAKEKTSADRVKKAVEFFMFKAPLDLLPGFVDSVLRDDIKQLRELGKKVVIYSDYPVEDKLKALSIEADEYYTSQDEEIGVMKPDKKGIEVILKDMNVPKELAVMIGDRYEKDGLAAIANDVDYIILSSKKSEREKLL